MSEQSSGTMAQAKEQAANVAGTARDQTADVASGAKEQARAVASEAAGQAHNLMDQSKEELRGRSAEQQSRLADSIRQFADQLTHMADTGEDGSLASSVVRQLADGGHRAAGYLEQREPGDLVADLQRVGRRRPGTFLLGAAVAGFAVARLGKAAKNAEPEAEPTTDQIGTAEPIDPYPTEPLAAGPYPTQPITGAPYGETT